MKTIKVVAICVAVFIGVIIIYHLFINGPSAKKPVDNSINIDFAYEDVNEEYTNPLYCGDHLFKVETEDEEIILSRDLKKIAEIPGKNNLFCLYDGYYLVKNNNRYSLMKNGSIIQGNIDFTNPQNYRTTLYQDSTDASSKHIAYLYLYNVILNQQNLIYQDLVYVPFNNDAGLLYDAITGQIIAQNIKKIFPVKMNEEEQPYLFIDASSTYLWDIKNNQKLLENVDIIWHQKTEDTVYTNSLQNFVYRENNQEGLINIKGNVILTPENQTIDIASANETYYAVAKNGKYGLINNALNVAFDYIYDQIIVMDDFIFAVKDKTLTIYDNLLKPVGDEYQILNNAITVTKYQGFYQVQNVVSDGTRELIVTNEAKTHLVTGIKLIENSTYFYQTPCYLVNDKGNFFIYFAADKQINLDTNFRDNVDHVRFLNDNRLYLDLKKDNKYQYVFYRVNTGAVLHSYIKDNLDMTFEVFANKDLVFSRENEKISIYYQNILQKEIEAQQIIPLADDFYKVVSANKNAWVKITY